MKRIRFFVAIFALVIGSLTISAQASFSGGSVSNFKKTVTYSLWQFSDVPPAAWYAPYVKEAYQYGAMSGVSETKFSPHGNLKISEAITMACWLNSVYYYGDADELGRYGFSQGLAWYQPYVNYAMSHNIIGNQYQGNYEKEATRADFVSIIEASLPSDVFQNKQDIANGSIPDVPAGCSYYNAVYHFYRAGIISGIDSSKAFKPANYITRAEAAVILSNILNVEDKQYSLNGLSTLPDLENYLNKTMSSCDTPMGSYALEFDVRQNSYNFNGWDIEIRTEGNYCVLPWAEISTSIEYTKQQKEETVEILKNLQKRIFEVASKSFPDKKLTGCYFSDWYKYPNAKVGYETAQHLSWANYESSDYGHDYDSTYITKFHWTPDMDD